MSRILITTDYLRAGDEVDEFLKGAGHETVHAPLTNKRDQQELVALLDGVDAALVAANEPLQAEVLQCAPSLRAIVRTGVGYDSVDVVAAAALGINVSNLPGINANAVAEYTMGLLLVAARRLLRSAGGVAGGAWPREDGHELRGATLGLIGYGAAARAVIPLAQAFGMTVLCTTGVPESQRQHSSVEFVSLPELLAAADYVSCHTALTAKTHHLLDAQAFRLMKPTAILVNTARGGVVDEAALADAVSKGEIAGAALDVVLDEPLPADSPLRGVEGIVVYSHLAGQTAQARAAAGIKGAEELLAALAGTPKHSVNAHLMRNP